jgi:hypothetical protein
MRHSGLFRIRRFVVASFATLVDAASSAKKKVAMMKERET